MDQAVMELQEAIGQFLSEHSDEFVSVNRVVNPLLALWKRSSDISPEMAVPIETLLTSLTGRKLVKSSELVETMQALRDLLDEHETLNLELRGETSGVA